jgi:hypothetical protein
MPTMMPSREFSEPAKQHLQICIFYFVDTSGFSGSTVIGAIISPNHIIATFADDLEKAGPDPEIRVTNPIETT